MQNLLRLSLYRRIVILLGIAAQIQIPLSICKDKTIAISLALKYLQLDKTVLSCYCEVQLINWMNDSLEGFCSVKVTAWLTFPEEKRWHPFTVSKMKGLRSGWAGRWDCDKDCFTFLISTRHKALSSPEWNNNHVFHNEMYNVQFISLLLQAIRSRHTSRYNTLCHLVNSMLTLFDLEKEPTATLNI